MVVGNLRTEFGDNQAFVWDQTNGMRDLTPGGGFAYGVNDNGLVVGSRYNGAGYSAFIWNPANGSFVEPVVGEAYAINNSGQVVGTGVSGAFLWSASQGVQTLGYLPGGYYGAAKAINSAGVVVGQSNDANGLRRAFIWDATNGMRDLSALLPANSG